MSREKLACKWAERKNDGVKRMRGQVLKYKFLEFIEKDCNETMRFSFR